jgi:hypothetical protein
VQVRAVCLRVLKTAKARTRPRGPVSRTPAHRLKQISFPGPPLAAGASGCARFMAATCGWLHRMRAVEGKGRPLPDAAPSVSGADGSALPPRRTGESEWLPPHSRSAIEPRRVGAERRRSGPGSPVTFCDGRSFFATASGQTQLTADILAAVQVVRPRLAAGAPRGPRLRADSDRNREEDGA